MSTFDISEEFFEEEKLDRTRQFSKKGGPYTKYDRKKRRDEVFRLHFEYGISAVKIAEMMKINRHTISKDIEFWNKRLREEWETVDIISWIMKIIHRLEIQRTSLYNEIESQTDIHDKITVRKLILEIDYKISQIIPKIATTRETAMNMGRDLANQVMKDHNIPKRMIGMYELQGVSKDTHEKIEKMIGEDRKNTTYWEFDNIEDEEEI